MSSSLNNNILIFVGETAKANLRNRGRSQLELDSPLSGNAVPDAESTHHDSFKRRKLFQKGFKPRLLQNMWYCILPVVGYVFLALVVNRVKSQPSAVLPLDREAVKIPTLPSSIEKFSPATSLTEAISTSLKKSSSLSSTNAHSDLLSQCIRLHQDARVKHLALSGVYNHTLFTDWFEEGVGRILTAESEENRLASWGHNFGEFLACGFYNHRAVHITSAVVQTLSEGLETVNGAGSAYIARLKEWSNAVTELLDRIESMEKKMSSSKGRQLLDQAKGDACRLLSHIQAWSEAAEQAYRETAATTTSIHGLLNQCMSNTKDCNIVHEQTVEATLNALKFGLCNEQLSRYGSPSHRGHR